MPLRLPTICLIFCSLLLLGLSRPDHSLPAVAADAATVEQLLRSLGDRSLEPHKPDKTISGYSIEMGAELILTGKTAKEGKKTKLLSKVFTCNACHNVRLEDPDPAHPNPNTRLYYAEQHGMAFLPATSLFGLVNRTSFFNGDYRILFEDRLGNAKRDIREAIRFCNSEFNKGRKIEDWEMESMLAYLWTLELKSTDIFITKEDMFLYHQGSKDPDKRIEALNNLRSKYVERIPASFQEEEKRFGKAPGAPSKQEGSLLFEKSCLHCHAQKRYSSIALDTTNGSISGMIEEYLSGKDADQLTHLLRHGTQTSKSGKPAMPAYSVQRLSAGQISSLKAFLGL